MAAHSLLGASGAHRWLNCPGSFRLSQVMPHRPSSVYAAIGTVAHEYIEAAWISGADALEPATLGRQVSEEGHVITLDQDFVDGVNVMLGYLRQIDCGLTDVEHTISLDHYVPNAPVSLFGTLDAAVRDTDALEIVDYKNGAGVTVSPVENPQLLFYAAGATSSAILARLRRIKLTIVQPHAPGNPIRSWEIAPVDLLMWIDEILIPGVEACIDPDAPLVPGTWCRFCPVAHGCPKLHEAAIEAAKHEFDDMPDTTDADLGQALAQALDTAERAQAWIEAVREFALDKLKAQTRIPGWELVPTRPTRQWTRDEADMLAAFNRAEIPNDLFWESKLRSPAQMEKVLSKTKAGRKCWDLIRPLVEPRSSGVKIGRTATDDEAFADE